jgi:hypothetical protein
MAEPNIVGSLFGVTPELYQEQRDLMRQKQAMEFAQQDPRTQATYAFGRAGQQLGQAFGGLMGVEDPQLIKIRQQQQVLSGLNINDPQAIAEAAQRANQMGNTQLALQLTALGDQALQRQDLSIERQDKLRQRQAAAQSLARTQTARDLISRGLSITPETISGQSAATVPEVDEFGNPLRSAVTGYKPPELKLDYARLAPILMQSPEGRAELAAIVASQKAMRPETVSIKEGETLYTVPTEPGQTYKPIASGGEKPRPFTGDLGNAANALYQTDDPAKIFARYGQPGIDAVEQRAIKMTEAKRPKIDVTAPVTINMREGFGKNLTEDLTANLRAGRAAGNTLGTVQSMKALIEEGTKTGFGQETMLQLGRAAQAFDPNFKVAGIAGAEAFQGLSNSVILPEVKKLGANPTDTDLKFIVQGSANLSKSPQGNLILLDTLELKLMREQDMARFSNQWLAQNANIVEKNPIVAQTQFNDAFANYTATSPLYKPQADALRQRMNQLQTMGGGRTPTPARGTLQRGGFTN